MVKKGKKDKKKEVPQCSGFGLAFDDDDDECEVCDVRDECKEKTEEGEDSTSTEDLLEEDGTDNKDDDDEDEEVTDDNVNEVVQSLLERVKKLETMIKGKPGSKKSKRADNAQKNAEKAERRAELLAGYPYSNSDLEDLKGKELKMLCSALEINSFGLTKEEAITRITLHQKKNVKKKGTKKTKAKK